MKHRRAADDDYIYCPRCQCKYFHQEGYDRHLLRHVWHDTHLKFGMLVFERDGSWIRRITKYDIEHCACGNGRDILNKDDVQLLIDLAPDFKTDEIKKGMFIQCGPEGFYGVKSIRNQLGGDVFTKDDLIPLKDLAPREHVRGFKPPINFYQLVAPDRPILVE